MSTKVNLNKDTMDVGRFRFCPACAAPVGEPQFNTEDPDHESFEIEQARCSGCDRPWPACPCEPSNQMSQK